MENISLDQRLVNATSVSSAENEGNSGEYASEKEENLTITAAISNPKMFTLPWHLPLSQWPEDMLLNLPRGISRHIVRFVRVGDENCAFKEINKSVAEREYELLRQLEKTDVPAVKPVAVVTGRKNSEGEPLEAILVTEHLKFSLPYRALFAHKLRQDTAELLIDALADRKSVV